MNNKTAYYDVEHGAIASQTWGSSDALSNEDMRMVLNWESYPGSQLNQIQAQLLQNKTHGVQTQGVQALHTSRASPVLPGSQRGWRQVLM